MLSKIPSRILLTTSYCVVVCCLALSPSYAQQPDKKVAENLQGKQAVVKKTPESAQAVASKEELLGKIVVDPIPAQFELWADRLGFNWQLMQSGALQSGPLSYYQSAMGLVINGKAFKATKAERLDGGAVKEGQQGRLLLSSEAEGVMVSRDVWFDPERGGVRYVDSFSNAKGKAAVRLTLQLKTMFRSSWQDLHGSSGKIMGGRDSSNLGSRDHAVLIKYSRSDGRPDTVVLVAGDGEVEKPKLAFSSNHRELSFIYQLEVPAGGKVALVHWIMQRNLGSPDEVDEVLRPFYLRRRLLQPRVERGLVKVVANFTEAALPENTVQPYSLESLVALKQATRPYGAQRLWEDVLWITAENQLAGKVNESAKLKIKTVLGERNVAIAQVAAIQGGGGVGRTPRVFLRDGQVLAGNIEARDLSMTSRDGWDMELKVEDLMFLLTQLREIDGKAPEGTSKFVALRSGDVLAVDEATASRVELDVLSPWGADRLSLTQIESLRYTNGAVPKYRLHRNDGSWMSVFLSGEDLGLKIPAADPVQVSPSEIAGIWSIGKPDLQNKADDDEWLDFEDIGERASLPTPCCLLVGSNLLHGEISMDVLHLVSGAAVTKINPGEIVSMERVDDQSVLPVFNLELSGGNRLKGKLRERSLTVKTSARTWEIPVQHFISYLNKEVK